MSNLGMYQKMTVAAKKVKGPINLMILVAASGYTFGKLCEMLGKSIYKISKKDYHRNIDRSTVCIAKGFCSSDDELQLTYDDKIMPLKRDKDVAIIDKDGDKTMILEDDSKH